MVMYQNNQWVSFWLGPTKLLHSSVRLPITDLKEEIMKKQGSVCNYCKDPIQLYPGSNCDGDHIIPITYGGSSDIDNLQLLCVPCHRIKTSLERGQGTLKIKVNGTTEGRLYAAFGNVILSSVSGTVKPSDFLELTSGVYEVDTVMGRKRKRETCTVSKPEKLNTQPKRVIPRKVAPVRPVIDELYTLVKIQLSETRIKQCRDLENMRRRDILVTFKYIPGVFNFKCKKSVTRFCNGVQTDRSFISYMTVAETQGNLDTEKEIRVVIKVQTKSAVTVGDILKKMYMIFPEYKGLIGFDASDKRCYLDKARELVAPREAIDVDPHPYVHGEGLKSLLNRIENKVKGAAGYRKNHETRDRALVEAVEQSNGSWARFVETDYYQNVGVNHPLRCRKAFDTTRATHWED